MKINLPLASSTWDHNEIQAMQNVISSRNFTMGKEVASFEADFAKYLDRKYCVMVNSGSSANLLMVGALFYTKNSLYRLRTNDEVIVPAISWSTSFAPLQQYGLKLRFVDIDLYTLNYNISDLVDSITPNTRAILAVNLLGNPNDYEKITQLADAHNLLILEDNCESLGASFNGSMAGSFGLMSSHSTFFSHHISTMEGGIIATDDEELYHLLLCLRAHGWSRNLPDINLVSGKKDSSSFNESFKFLIPGYNLRPLELSGAVGIQQLKKLPTFVAQRRSNAHHFQSVFRDNPNFIIQREVGESSWFGFSLTMHPNSQFSRDYILRILDDIAVDYRPIVAGSFIKNPTISYYNYSLHSSLPNAEYITDNGFFIGNHHFDLTTQLSQLESCLAEAMQI